MIFNDYEHVRIERKYVAVDYSGDLSRIATSDTFSFTSTPNTTDYTKVVKLTDNLYKNMK